MRDVQFVDGHHQFPARARVKRGIAANGLTQKECFGRGQSGRFACLTFTAPTVGDIQMLK